MASYTLALILVASLALAGWQQVRCEEKTQEQMVSMSLLFQTVTDKLQNLSHVMEDITGIDIPSTQEEVKSALEDNLKSLKESAQSLQTQFTGNNTNTVTDMFHQLQSQVNQTLEDLGKRNPDLGKMMEQVKNGYSSLVEVSKKVQEVVEEQAGHAGDDLKNIAQQVRAELSKAATKLEAQVQGALAENKKTKTT